MMARRVEALYSWAWLELGDSNEEGQTTPTVSEVAAIAERIHLPESSLDGEPCVENDEWDALSNKLGGLRSDIPEILRDSDGADNAEDVSDSASWTSSKLFMNLTKHISFSLTASGERTGSPSLGSSVREREQD